jgi:hypothetical protein
MSNVEDDKLRTRLAEIMSSAGLGYNQISLEILYLLPKDFVDRYIELWEKALGPAVNAPGDALAREGNLGRAKTRTDKKGAMVGAGGGGGGKRFRRVFTIRDERALELKARIDRRLRSIARDIRVGIEAEESELQGEGVGGAGKQCGGCGRIYAMSYNFCPKDGKALTAPKSDRDIA